MSRAASPRQRSPSTRDSMTSSIQARLQTFVALVRRNPSAGLLVVQLLGVVLYPLMEYSPRGRALFGIFGLFVLAFALAVVHRGPWLTWLGVTLALPVVALSIVTVIKPPGPM